MSRTAFASRKLSLMVPVPKFHKNCLKFGTLNLKKVKVNGFKLSWNIIVGWTCRVSTIIGLPSIRRLSHKRVSPLVNACQRRLMTQNCPEISWLDLAAAETRNEVGSSRDATRRHCSILLRQSQSMTKKAGMLRTALGNVLPAGGNGGGGG